MAKLDKFVKFHRDVNRAYKKGIVCPINGQFYTRHNQKEYGCALTAAYMVNGNQPTESSDNEIEDWAKKHYGFTQEEIMQIEASFDNGEIAECKGPASEVALKLHKKHESKLNDYLLPEEDMY